MSEAQLASLDRAQQEVNRVLELLGRVFAATKTSNKASANAATVRLRQALPLSSNNYHNALDELEQQLQFAKLVMRRDLALATKQPEPVQEAIETVPEPVTADMTAAPVESEKALDAAEAPTTIDLTDGDDMQITASGADAAPEPLAEQQPADGIDILRVETAQSAQDSSKAAQDAEKAPDTAMSNNADMDSLFNDSMSAADGDAAASFDFDKATTSNADFDFDAFSASLAANSNEETKAGVTALDISDNVEPEFSALFGDSTGDVVTASQDNSQQDFNFDDLMDLGIPEAGGNSNNNFDIDFT